MVFDWLKQYMPRGLYGRALLILLLPVLFLQLLVSVVFIQRHFEGVTRQMTNSVAIELRFVADSVDAAQTRAAAEALMEARSAPLELDADWAEAVPVDPPMPPWWDFTAASVRAYLAASLPDLQSVSFADRRRVTVWVATAHGPIEVSVARSRLSASNPHQLLVIMVVLGSLMTVIALIFLRNQLRPIRRLARAATAYGRGRVVPFTPAGAVEVRAAGMAFLDMRNRLERQVQSRTLMLSGISHDLRTPLTRLRLGLSLLDEAEAKPLIRDVDEMQQQLDAFLAFARAEAEEEVERVAPAAVLDGVLADAARMGQPVAAGRREGGDDPVPLRPAAIRRALENLIGNAIRYGERAEVSLFVTAKAVRFVVEDDGPGIPPAQRDEAVRPFTRLDPARNQDRGPGVGLGLAIVSEIARGHGGTLRLGESDRLGGLKSELILPR